MRGINKVPDEGYGYLAKKLRQEQTEAEKRLWFKIRSGQVNGVKFRRQEPIKNYIVDFVSYEKKLIIEIDGGQHSEEENYESDKRRTQWLESQGFRVIRFWNNDVLSNIDGVLASIDEALQR